MKTTLTYILLALGAGCTAAAFAGLVGIVSPTVFHGSAIALSIFAATGMLLVGANDHSRRPLVTGSTPPFPGPVCVVPPAARRSRAYGIRRRGNVSV